MLNRAVGKLWSSCTTEYHAVIKKNSCRASFFDCLFPPSGISMLLFLWGTILPSLSVSIVGVGVQEVGIGQREELSCDAGAIKKPQMTPAGSSGAGFILQCCPILRQRGWGSALIHPTSITGWELTLGGM